MSDGLIAVMSNQYVTLSLIFSTIFKSCIIQHPQTCSAYVVLLIVFACSPHLPILSIDLSLFLVQELLSDPDPTHKSRADKQLPLSSGLNRPSLKFPYHCILSKLRLLPIIPDHLHHSSIIFGSSCRINTFENSLLFLSFYRRPYRRSCDF